MVPSPVKYKVVDSREAGIPSRVPRNDAACPATDYRDYRGKPCLPAGLVCSYAGDGVDGYCSSTAGSCVKASVSAATAAWIAALTAAPAPGR